MSRLTLFNAHRGCEPTRLTLQQWNNAEQDAWNDQQLVQSVNDPLEREEWKNAEHVTECLQTTIFQQDNAPCHTSKVTHAFFQKSKINVLKCPRNSPWSRRLLMNIQKIEDWKSHYCHDGSLGQRNWPDRSRDMHVSRWNTESSRCTYAPKTQHCRYQNTLWHSLITSFIHAFVFHCRHWCCINVFLFVFIDYICHPPLPFSDVHPSWSIFEWPSPWWLVMYARYAVCVCGYSTGPPRDFMAYCCGGHGSPQF